MTNTIHLYYESEDLYIDGYLIFSFGKPKIYSGILIRPNWVQYSRNVAAAGFHMKKALQLYLADKEVVVVFGTRPPLALLGLWVNLWPALLRLSSRETPLFLVPERASINQAASLIAAIRHQNF
ncbi:hypothetical protein CEXT_170481 [Caerostris extrusa]|uniref:Uncharacterized protein n=1 Tax=Caerostris extrusa TaxID=172846 RepID=A0AAV4M7Y8_CAEEX|nr:hypothetical protein CEXT_170481 [Caerostris extrusa]